MKSFEILCTTMHQTDFSKIGEMNIHSNVVFANQADETSYKELEFEKYNAKMITTSSRGVGKNRNIALIHASCDICLFADDDVYYCEGYEDKILKAFDALPEADVIIFNIRSNDNKGTRQPPQIKKISRLRKFSRNPYGGPRIAFRHNSFLQKNIFFTQLFGGGTKYSHGEDTIWLNDCLKAGLKVYKYPELIAIVDYGISSWFSGYGEKYFYDQGAKQIATHGAFFTFLHQIYYALRTQKRSNLSFMTKLKWMRNGTRGYKKLISYEEYINGKQL